MPFKPNDVQKEMLTSLNSSYHFESLPQPRPSPKEDPPAPMIRCSIVDIKHKTPYASALGVTEEGAFIEAIKAAHSADKPQTAAEIAAERDALKAQVEAMKRNGGITTEPKRRGRPPRKPLVAPAPVTP